MMTLCVYFSYAILTYNILTCYYEFKNIFQEFPMMLLGSPL